MFAWLRSLLKYLDLRSIADKPWHEEDFHEISTESSEFARFRDEAAILLCALSDPKSAGITSEEMNRATAKAIDDYVGRRAPYMGGALQGFDRFVTSNRIVRMREDYLHIHHRETHADLGCVHIFDIPSVPEKLLWLSVKIDQNGRRASVLTEHESVTESPTRIQWRLVREAETWKIHQMNPVHAS